MARYKDRVGPPVAAMPWSRVDPDTTLTMLTCRGLLVILATVARVRAQYPAVYGQCEFYLPLNLEAAII